MSSKGLCRNQRPGSTNQETATGSIRAFLLVNLNQLPKFPQEPPSVPVGGLVLSCPEPGTSDTVWPNRQPDHIVEAQSVRIMLCYPVSLGGNEAPRTCKPKSVEYFHDRHFPQLHLPVVNKSELPTHRLCRMQTAQRMWERVQRDNLNKQLGVACSNRISAVVTLGHNRRFADY